MESGFFVLSNFCVAVLGGRVEHMLKKQQVGVGRVVLVMWGVVLEVWGGVVLVVWGSGIGDVGEWYWWCGGG